MNFNIFNILKKRAVKRRNRELDEWGSTIQVTDEQQEVLNKLWKASKNNKPPSEDPLLSLSTSDRKYLLKICSADFRPAKFGDANILRMAAFNELTEKGFNPEQAAVIIGMIFNAVGMKEIEGAT